MHGGSREPDYGDNVLRSHHSNSRTLRVVCECICIALICSWPARAQDFTVTGQVDLVSEGHTHRAQKDRANVVIWLTPHDDRDGLRSVSEESKVPTPRLLQKNKTFEPHLLVVQAGTAVEFPESRSVFSQCVFAVRR